MTIRAKLFAAIALTILGPLVTIGVALAAFGTLGDRFDEVAAGGARQARALELKFAVTDMNGWQTAYGYDGGRSRAQFVTAAERTEELLEAARGELTAPGERALLERLGTAFDRFMALDAEAWEALQRAARRRPSGSCSAPRCATFDTMARAADALAEAQDRRAAVAEREFDDARRRPGASWWPSRSAPGS